MLSQYETGEDALANVSTQLSRKINKDITSKIISQLTGLFGTALADNVLNVAAAAGGTTDDSNYCTAASITAAKYLLGEKAADVKVLVVHPLVAADLEARGMLTFVNSGGTVNYASNGIGVTDTQIGYMAGLRVVVDSQVPTVDPTGGSTGDAVGYTCYLAAPGVIRTGSQFPLTVRSSEDILSLQNIMSIEYNRIDHVLGTSYGGDMHPENAILADKTTGVWAYTSHENVPSGGTHRQHPLRGHNGLITLQSEELQGPFGALFLSRQNKKLPLRSLGMCGLIKLMVYRNGVTDVLHVTYSEVKETRRRLSAEGWTLYHSEVI